MFYSTTQELKLNMLSMPQLAFASTVQEFPDTCGYKTLEFVAVLIIVGLTSSVMEYVFRSEPKVLFVFLTESLLLFRKLAVFLPGFRLTEDRNVVSVLRDVLFWTCFMFCFIRLKLDLVQCFKESLVGK